jgi:3-hydroxymyristoyl/3-hydroxydecanoyl-(acyl carrier protein) dehydratase
MSFLFVDKILKTIPGEYISGIKTVTQHDYYLSKNHKDQDIFVSSLIGETLGQLAAWNVMDYFDFQKRPVAGICSSANIFAQVTVGQDILLESFIDKIDNDAVVYHSVAKVDDRVVFTIETALGPLLPMQDFIARDLALAQYQSLFVDKNNALVAERETHADTFVFDSCTFQDGKCIAHLYVDPNKPYFTDHFPNKPVLPLTVLLEAKANLLPTILKKLELSSDYQVYSMRKIKMNTFVEPGSTLSSEVSVKFDDTGQLILQFVSLVLDKRVCVVQMLCKKLDDKL